MRTDLRKLANEHLRMLCEVIGERPGGSTGDHMAARYIQEIFVRSGWDVEEQRFDCPAWLAGNTQLILDGNPLNAGANAFSPPCNVKAEIIGAGTVAELENANLKHKIGLLYGDLIQGPLSPKSWFLISEREDKLIQLLEAKQPAALLTVQQHRGGLERLIEDWEFHIPSATVTPETALALLQAEAQKAQLLIESELSSGYSANIVARSIKKHDSRVVICAHFDTKIDTPGALDNGSGTAVLLALAQSLKETDYPFSLEFVAFTNEEYMPIGDDEYLRRDGDNLGNIIAAINIDSVGQRLAANSIAIFSANADFESELQRIAAQYPGLVWVDPWPQSNHSTFAMRGVPSVAFSSTGRIELAHFPEDDMRWIDPAKVAEVVLIIREILLLLKQKPTNWTRKE